jgi:predicted esterase
MTVIKRFHDCLLPTHQAVLDTYKKVERLAVKDGFLRKASGYQFYNISPFTFKTLIADPENIFLLGNSGGGHMALLLAGYRPEYFKAIGAFVPITDLKKWAEENPKYRSHVLACCNEDEEQMLLRSPCHYKENILKANLKIFHGKYDQVVPVSQSLTLYADLMAMDPQARVFLDIFDGGHQLDMSQAMYWLLSQYKGKELVQITG